MYVCLFLLLSFPYLVTWAFFCVGVLGSRHVYANCDDTNLGGLPGIDHWMANYVSGWRTITTAFLWDLGNLGLGLGLVDLWDLCMIGIGMDLDMEPRVDK